MRRSRIFLLLLTGIFVFTITGQGAWYANDPPPPTPPPTPPPGADSSSREIDDLIIDGASCLLESYSTFFLLVNESELSAKKGFDSWKALFLTDTILSKLEAAQITYSVIAADMRQGTFDQTAIYKLKEFDYDTLLTTRRFNAHVFGKVKQFLADGDLPGFFDTILVDLGKIILELKHIRGDLQKDIPPDIEALRGLYEHFSDFMLMGYYSSLIFSKIKE